MFVFESLIIYSWPILYLEEAIHWTIKMFKQSFLPIWSDFIFEIEMISFYPLGFIQSGISQGDFHSVEGHEGVVTVDSVNVADGDGREVNLEDNCYDS